MTEYVVVPIKVVDEPEANNLATWDIDYDDQVDS